MTAMKVSDATIYALSSGALPAGVAIVRVSGPKAGDVVVRLFGRLPAPRSASYGVIGFDPVDPIDRGLVIWFPGPASFTGEDCAEFHLHGGRAVVRALLDAVSKIEGMRPAEAGEFSRRAFQNDRMDLTAIEGLADLVNAETEAQRRVALRQAGGATASVLDRWRTRVVRCRALIEADLDFADEEDVPGSVADSVWAQAAALADEMERHLQEADRGERLRSGFDVVLLGRPNAGKSSLLNALARRPAAIVTPEPGTTRDLIEVRLDLGGYPVTLVDTAGLREGGGSIEAEGMRRARDRAERADLILWLQAPDDIGGVDDVGTRASSGDVWCVATKSDLGAAAGTFAHRISTLTGEGLGALERALGAFVAHRIGGIEDVVITRARHRDGVAACVRHLRAAVHASDAGLELRAEDLRAAADTLGRLTGRIDVEDLLDVIFRDFCIGK
jgi:tRNA modification GTPase